MLGGDSIKAVTRNFLSGSVEESTAAVVPTVIRTVTTSTILLLLHVLRIHIMYNRYQVQAACLECCCVIYTAPKLAENTKNTWPLHVPTLPSLRLYPPASRLPVYCYCCSCLPFVERCATPPHLHSSNGCSLRTSFEKQCLLYGTPTAGSCPG